MARKISDFCPDDDLIQIPIFVLKDLQEKGYAYMPLPNGRIIRITDKDLLFKREEIEKFMKTDKFKNMQEERKKKLLEKVDK